jgi:integrase
MEEPVFGVKLKKTGTRVPVVLSKGETQRLLGEMDEEERKSDKAEGIAKEPEKPHGRYALAARLQYGAGLRLSEVVRLRVQDLDLDRGTLTVRAGKGDKDRMTVLPRTLVKQVAEQIERAREVWCKDREEGLPGVYLPNALARKFRRAAESFEWSRRRLRLTRLKRAKPRDRRFLRGDALAGKRDGPADDPGYPGARGYQHDGDLPACGDGREWLGSGESAG